MIVYLSVLVDAFQTVELAAHTFDGRVAAREYIVAPTGDNSNRAAREFARREWFLNIFKVEQSNDLRFREVTVRVRYGCSPATVLRGSATFNLVSHCQLKVCMYRAIKKALPLSVCETDTTTVVEVDKGQRFITSVNYVLLIRSSYRSRIANIRIHFEFAKNYGLLYSINAIYAS